MDLLLERWSIRVDGVVQGVGFRPFVYTQAGQRELTGWVYNDSRGVLIEAQGPAARLADFVAALSDRAPVLARVREVSVDKGLDLEAGSAGFEIRHSADDGTLAPTTIVPPDSHVCEDCLAELTDPADRRYRYPFVNCTNCGPRYSIIKALPYDRPATTMSVFPMCEACRREYQNPADRRYHAQPIACADCGPTLTAVGPDGASSRGEQALAAALDALAAGLVVAVKSLGGFHLAVNARDERAVGRLRARKRRDAKAFAVMAAHLGTVAEFAEYGDAEARLLRSPARPIVLLRKRGTDQDRGGLAPDIAPRNPNLGVMLPSAPLHHLLLERAGMDVLVMTSGNISGYPIAYRNQDALDQLFDVADLILLHDREIETRVDDSVMRVSTHPELAAPLTTFVRRSKGYAPYPLDVPIDLGPVVAFGAELKSTVALAAGRRVYISQHIGDLKNDETYASHRQAAAHLARLHRLAPSLAACDLHPDFRVSRFAREEYGEDLEQVQHHHAHMAACMAENQLTGPTLGVVFDGAGYGLDGTIWGGEFLLGDYAAVERVAHLRRFPLLGGDRAVHEPIRTGLALTLAAFDASESDAATVFPTLGELDPDARRVLARMAERGINSPQASSMGRLFDGVAALLGVCTRAEYEAHGPIELEGLLGRDLGLAPAYPLDGVGAELDWRPTIRAVAADLDARVSAAEISRRFHSTIVAMVLERCQAVRAESGVRQVVLSGGVFLNEFLLVNCLIQLRRAGFAAYCHELTPTNDGGISLGQIMVAGARRATKERRG